MTFQKTWTDFGREWQDGDIIDLREESGTPGEISFVLMTDPSGQNAQWWRALALVDQATGWELAKISNAGNNHGPSAMSFQTGQLQSAFINIRKAKAFGIETGMYDLRDLTAKAGKRLIFDWKRFG